MTISLSDRGMVDLESATAKFKHLGDQLPSFFTTPGTKASVAAWLVNRYSLEVTKIINAILIERIEDMPDTQKDSFLSLVKSEFGCASDNEGLDTYRTIIRGLSGDPYFQSIRNLLRLGKD